MQQFIELTAKAGSRQKCLLFELSKQAIICLNRETNMWMRGALTCRLAKDLLLKTDKTISERIADIEPHILRNEREAERLGVKLSGVGRNKLNELYKLKKLCYPDFMCALGTCENQCFTCCEDEQCDKRNAVVIWGEPLRCKSKKAKN